MMASGGGRSLEATGDASGGSAIRFKTGDVIVAADPLVHVLESLCRNKKRCDNCYKISPDVKRCSGCRLFQYCGSDCQLEDWQSFHKHGECRLLHKLSSVQDFVFEFLTGFMYVPLFLRTHLLLKAKPELMHQKFQMHDGTERSLADVRDDAEAGLHMDLFIAASSPLMSVDRSNYSEENVDIHLSIFHKIRRSFLIINKGKIGIGLYVPITGLKHSCRPNASYVFKGKKLEVRAMRDIAEGEDVTIDLIDVMQPKADRQKELAEWRGILCDCDRCREGDQDDEVTELAACEEYRKFMCIPERVLTSPRPVFDGFMRVMAAKEKYQGRYHPGFVVSMSLAATAATALPYKTVRDKQNFDLLVERLKEAIPLSFGLDGDGVNMQRFLLMIDASDWSYLLP